MLRLILALIIAVVYLILFLPVELVRKQYFPVAKEPQAAGVRIE